MLDTTLDPQENEQMYAMDHKLYVVFYNKPVQLGFKSQEAGRPIFEDRAHIRIHVPGDKTTVIDDEVNDLHKRRFPKQWEKFQQAQSQSPEGTPVEQWPQLTGSQAQELKAVNVFTVEQLADMSDGQVMKFMGGMTLRDKAKAFLLVAKDTAAAQKFATENTELRAQVAALIETTKLQGAQLEALLTKQNTQSTVPSAPTPQPPGAYDDRILRQGNKR